MNSLLIAIIIIIIIILINTYVVKYNMENFTNDEAVKNLASLYNQGQLSVSNFTTTGTATINALNVNSATNTNTLMVGNGATINGDSSINSITTKGLTSTGAVNANTLAIGNGSVINGNSSINSINTNGINVNGNIYGNALKVTNGIKLGPWNLVGDTNGLYMFNDNKQAGIIINPNGLVTMGVRRGQTAQDFGSYATVDNCPGCWAQPPNV